MNVPRLKDSKKYRSIVSKLYFVNWSNFSPYTLSYKTDTIYAPFWLEGSRKESLDIVNHRKYVYNFNPKTQELIRHL